MSDDKKHFSKKIRCGHCGNEAPMAIKAIFSQVKENHEYDHCPIDEGDVHELMVCPACDGVTLGRYYYHDGLEPNGSETKILYPANNSSAILGLPPKLQKEFDAAIRVRPVSANAYGVLLGRLIELVCDDRGAKKGTLKERLQELSAKDEIPEKLVTVADTLQQFRHMGAHAWVGELSSSEIPILDDLCRAILEYVYSGPHLVQRAEERLTKLREKERKKKKR